MDAATYNARGGQWPTSPEAGINYACFTGDPTLNTFGGQYTTFKISANQSIMVEIGDLLTETGVTGMVDELEYGTTYYFVAFALDGSGTASSALSSTVSATTTVSTNCTYTQGYWKTHEEQWPVLSLFLGSVNYTKAELLSIFGEAVTGNRSCQSCSPADCSKTQYRRRC